MDTWEKLHSKPQRLSKTLQNSWELITQLLLSVLSDTDGPWVWDVIRSSAPHSAAKLVPEMQKSHTLHQFAIPLRNCSWEHFMVCPLKLVLDLQPCQKCKQKDTWADLKVIWTIWKIHTPLILITIVCTAISIFWKFPACLHYFY